MVNNSEIKVEAVKLICAWDAGELEWVGCQRTAQELADFWIEHQFARADIDCNWDEAKCTHMASLMKKQLKVLGLP